MSGAARWASKSFSGLAVRTRSSRFFVLPGDLDVDAPHTTAELVALARRYLPGWRLIVAGSLLALIMWMYQSATARPEFVAESLLAIMPSATRVEFEPSITSSNRAYVPGLKISAEHRQALLDLVRASRIESAVRARLGPQLTAADLQPGALVQRIQARVQSRSDVLAIRAEANHPEDALMLANAWASAYAAEVNRIYASPNILTTIESERDMAFGRRAAAEAALVRDLDSGRLEQIGLRMDLAVDQLRVLRDEGEEPDYRALRRARLNELAQAARRFEVARLNARSLLYAARADASLADSVTVDLLATQVVTSSTVENLQLKRAPNSETDGAASLTALVESIDSIREDLAARINSERTRFELAREQEIARLEDELRGLRADYQEALSIRTSLLQGRDLADKTYQTLARKAEERRVAAGTIERQVEVVGVAVTTNAIPIVSVREELALSVACGLALVLLGSILKRFVPLGHRGLAAAAAR